MSPWLHLKRTAEAKVRQRTRDESNKWEDDARDKAVPRRLCHRAPFLPREFTFTQGGQQETNSERLKPMAGSAQ